MSLWKNGMLLLAGGAIGICLAAMVQASIENDNRRSHDEDDELPDGIDLLMSKIRYEAEAAMESCATDADRDVVYEQIKATIHEIQERIHEKGEEMIAALQNQARELDLSGAGGKIPTWMDKSAGEAPPIPKWMRDKDGSSTEDAQSHVQEIKAAMQKMTDVFDETLNALNPEQQPPLSQA